MPRFEFRIKSELPMPRYFFHVTHREPRVDDTVGVVLADRKAAWIEATTACGEMIRDIDGQLAVGTDWLMEVSDEEGPVFRIRFAAESFDDVTDVAD